MTFFVKKKCKQLTHLFFATDIRGSERTYRKFFPLNTIVMGGDISDKRLILTIKEGNGHYRATLQGICIRCFVTGGNDDDPEVLEVI